MAVFIGVSLALIFAFLYSIECFLIPALEDEKLIVSRGWKEDGWKIAQMSYQRWKHPSGSILESPGIPVSPSKVNAKRILVCGDSFAAGYGLPNVNDVWWRALQRELTRRGYNDVEVIGICGGRYGSTAGVFAQVKQYALSYHPDLVLFGYVCDDPEELENGQYIVPHLTRYDPDAATRMVRRFARSIFPNITEVVTSFQDKVENTKLSGPVRGFDYNPRELELLKGKNLERYQKTLQDISSTFKEWKIPCYFVTLPCVAGFFPEFDLQQDSSEYFQYIHEYCDQRYGKIAPHFAKENVRFINVLEPYTKMLQTDPQLKGRGKSALLCATPADGHPSNLVTHFYAVQVADMLEKEGSSVLGEKSAALKTFPLKINDWMPPNANVYKLSDRSYVFVVPPHDGNQLFMPVRQPHIQLNFEMPIELKTIKLQGPGLKQSTIWLSSIDPKDGYDRGILHKLETKKGAAATWQLSSDTWTHNVNTIKISSVIKGPDRRLVITF